MSIVRQEAGHAASAHGSQAVSETRVAPGSSRTGRGRGGQVLRRHMHTHDFGDNSRDSGTAQPVSMPWPCENPGPWVEEAPAVGRHRVGTE